MLEVQGIASNYNEAIEQITQTAEAFFGPETADFQIREFEAHEAERSYTSAIPLAWAYRAEVFPC